MINLKSCHVKAIKLSHMDETMESRQGHLAGVLPFNNGLGSGQAESTCSSTAGVYEQNLEASITYGESSHSSQVTLPSVLGYPLCSVEEIVNQPRHQSFAMVMPPPLQK